MGTENFSEDVLLVALPPEPRATHELQALNNSIFENCEFDVIIDFSRVELIASPSISNLLLLNDRLGRCEHKLVFCGVRFTTKCLFVTVGLDRFVHFADDKFSALAALQRACGGEGK
jgi:anti-anti-sigma regulatory factor